MKNFLKRRWHGIPVGLILVLTLVGIVAASYNFLSGTVGIEVKESCTFQTWDGSSWVDRGEGFTISLIDVYPGESEVVPMQVVNDSSVSLTVTGVYAMSANPTGGYGKVTGSGGFSGGVTCDPGITRDDLTLTVGGDAPPGTYTFTVDFNRS